MHGLREGASATDRPDTRRHILAVAEAVWDLAAGGYGPGGGTTLVDGELLESPASALRAMPADPMVSSYQRLAADVQTHVGDGASTAVLLAARLVMEAGTAMEDGLRPAPLLEGYTLARRQAMAALRAARTADQGALATVVPAAWAEAILGGLPRIVESGVLDLDEIHLHEDNVEVPTWTDGLVMDATAHTRRPRQDTRVLLVRGGPPKTRTAATMRLRTPTRTDDRRLAAIVEHVQAAGIGFVACEGDLGEDLAGRLTARGILVAQNTGRSAMKRLVACTGADLEVHPEQFELDGLGRADVMPRPVRRGGYLVHGPGPGATLLYPGGTPTLAAARKDAMERALRLAGVLLADRHAVPGGGRWQRDVAQGLRHAAPHAPGKAPLGIEAAARAFDALADTLVRNTGQDPLDVPRLGEAEDAYGAVRAAVSGAFEVATSLLRLDGVFRKRSSDPEDLRGNLGPAGSPKGMPGDVPPDM